MGQLLVKKKAAACVNLIPGITSWYWWKGKPEEGKEYLLLIKTHRKKLSKLYELLRVHHSYKLPEFIAVGILWGERDYLNWLRSSLKV